MKRMVIYQNNAILREKIAEQKEVEEGEILEVKNRFSVHEESQNGENQHLLLEDVQNGVDHVIENQQIEDDGVNENHTFESLSSRSWQYGEDCEVESKFLIPR